MSKISELAASLDAGKAALVSLLDGKTFPQSDPAHVVRVHDQVLTNCRLQNEITELKRPSIRQVGR
jgi:hypothetical protein